MSNTNTFLRQGKASLYNTTNSEYGGCIKCNLI